jgi:hypothetical protein
MATYLVVKSELIVKLGEGTDAAVAREALPSHLAEKLTPLGIKVEVKEIRTVRIGENGA